MINHDHKFIFIHCNRTGGTSVEHFFTGETETTHKHWFPYDWKKHYPHEWKTYFKFTTVRNPWDKVLSQWAIDKKWWGDVLPHNHPDRRGSGYHKEFKEFVKYGQAKGFPLRPQLWDLSEPHCISKKDIINYVEEKIDHIMRFENLTENFHDLCGKLGIEDSGLPHKYDSKEVRKNIPYQEFYDDETRDIIARIYDIDIKYFGYSF
mgnify:CR=1 FL=1|jgi:chondroitin 4-sulfotransferase 11|tara:strand:+ start:790 stop:1407 length:618 start_codon:yes stop_codon:yes gene_type:complete